MNYEIIHSNHLRKGQFPMESVMDQIRKHQAEIDRLMDEGKREALKKAEDAVAELNSLGFNYRLIESSSSQMSETGEGSRKKTRQIDADKQCPICEFGTDPPHDARRHRGQKDNKHPFTDEELNALGMTRV